MKTALYVRVSTQEQNPEMQRKALVEKAEREGWEYDVFEEKESTRKTRPIKYALYQRLLNKEFDAVVVWKIDRWARSTQELSREVTTLFNKGVKFISLTDNIDLSSASGTLQFNIISAFAQFERDIISERTKEGLKGKKNVGKRGKDKKRRRKSGYYQRWINKKS
jgi:DNA invertase Pin-like site-specific DNA recombinase